MAWEQYAAVFTWDGSLRDLYIHGTTLANWQRLLDGLGQGPYALRYDSGGESMPLPKHVETIFADWNEKTPLLSVDASQLRLICHFFSPHEIEFDLDPRVLDSAARRERLRDFIHLIGQLVGREVHLTPENVPEHPILRYDPQAGTEDCRIDYSE